MAIILSSFQRITKLFLLLALIQLSHSQKEYKLTVKNGSGSGLYTAGEKLRITADPPDSGEKFAHWERPKNRGDARVEDIAVYNRTTRITMPEGDAYVEATYVDRRMYELRVWRGWPDDYYEAGEIVRLEAKEYDGMKFTHWQIKEGDASGIEDINAKKTRVIMPEGRLELRAMYRDRWTSDESDADNSDADNSDADNSDSEDAGDEGDEDTDPLDEGKYRLTVKNGSGSGLYAAGEKLRITADPPDSGEKFAYWERPKSRGDARVEDIAVYNRTTRITMPEGDAYVEASYVDRRMYELRVWRGWPDDYYEAGEIVRLEAREYDGMKFTHWQIKEGDASGIEDIYAKKTRVIMPEGRLELRAMYRDRWTSSVRGAGNNGSRDVGDEDER